MLLKLALDTQLKTKIYFKSNLEGFFNILEISRHNNIKHLIYASIVLFMEFKKIFISEINRTDYCHFIATKKSNEVMAHSYSYIYKLPVQELDFLQFMDLLVGQIWLYLNLQKIY